MKNLINLVICTILLIVSINFIATIAYLLNDLSYKMQFSGAYAFPIWLFGISLGVTAIICYLNDNDEIK